MYKFILVFSVILLLQFTSCDPSGNLFLTNGYPFDVIVYVTYDYQGQILNNHIEFTPGMVFAPGAMGHKEYNHVISFKLEDSIGNLLAEYDINYLIKIRNNYKSQIERHESWIFTKKGLFYETKTISRKYNFDAQKIIEYYRSDEAVKDLQERLKEADQL
ncbi:MAG: hypothetical protein LBM77_11255 [Spirochaetaceae bacterium]|jgi:hypothetical protein|nr:hypothetical protein [Spirochaetaceae bacterium]